MAPGGAGVRMEGSLEPLRGKEPTMFRVCTILFPFALASLAPAQ
jgi:hypothetical protein